jgi:ElaA protein
MPKTVIKGWAELDKDELYQLLRLRSDVFVVEQECAYQDLDGKDIQANHFLVYQDETSAEQELELMAYCRSYQDIINNKDYVAIGRVCTNSHYRGQGVSRKMMQKAIDYYQKHSELPLTVSAQAYLEGFYRSLGFETILEPYLEDGIPHIRMVREI